MDELGTTSSAPRAASAASIASPSIAAFSAEHGAEIAPGTIGPTRLILCLAKAAEPVEAIVKQAKCPSASICIGRCAGVSPTRGSHGGNNPQPGARLWGLEDDWEEWEKYDSGTDGHRAHEGISGRR